MPSNSLSAAKRVRLNEREFEGLTTETLIRWGEHGPLAGLDVICIRRDIVCERLVIYKCSIDEESTAPCVGRWIVNGRSVTALEDLELWRVSSDAAILVGLGLENAIEVEWHRLAGGGWRKVEKNSSGQGG